MKFNERTKHITYFILEKSPPFVVSWEIDGETYTQREVPMLALPWKLVRDDLTLWSAACPWFDSDSLLLSKSDRVVIITWSPSGYTPVVSDCPDVLSYPCLLITAWQLVKALGVTRERTENPCHMLYNNSSASFWTLKKSAEISFNSQAQILFYTCIWEMKSVISSAMSYIVPLLDLYKDYMALHNLSRLICY